MWGDEDDSYNRKYFGAGSGLSQAQMYREIIQAFELLKSENTKLKDTLTEVKDSLRVANNDRQQLIKQIEEHKAKFGSSVEAKYAKAMAAMFAIAESMSEDSAVIIANSIIDELGERK
jgi:capsular polysaccharide biosynthesis protein